MERRKKRTQRPRRQLKTEMGARDDRRAVRGRTVTYCRFQNWFC